MSAVRAALASHAAHAGQRLEARPSHDFPVEGFLAQREDAHLGRNRTSTEELGDDHLVLHAEAALEVISGNSLPHSLANRSQLASWCAAELMITPSPIEDGARLTTHLELFIT